MNASRIQGTAAVLIATLVVSTLQATAAAAAVGRTPTAPNVTQSGEATYAIPIFTPPGTHGMQPQLAIKYGSRGGGQLLGTGWHLSGLSLIQRCARTWAQDGAPRSVRNDATDRFCLDGNKLRVVAGTYGAAGAEYRTEIETFSRIYSLGTAGNGPAYFTVEMKNGLVYEYGNSTDSRAESLGQTTARAWAVNKIRDRAGNAVLFTYTEDANGSFRIDNIQYTSNLSQGLTAAYAVTFVYELRPGAEIIAGYVAGGPIREVYRLDRIDVTHSGTIVRRYELTYEGTLSSTSRSRLASVQECGGSGGTDCLPATTFAYQNGGWGLSAAVSTGSSVPSGSSPWSIDVSGDGRDDLVYPSSTTAGSGYWMVMIASASGGYGAPINTNVLNHGYFGAIPIDYNADGKEDLLVPYSGGTWWVMLGSASGLAAPVNTGAPATATGTGNNAAAADIDGDGLEDLVWADVSTFTAPGDAIRYRRRELAGTFSSTVTNLVGPMPAEWYINPGLIAQYGQQAKRRLPDLDGDGRRDIFFDVESQQNFVYNYWNFKITGGATETTLVSPASPRPVFADINRDGKSDTFYATPQSSWIVRFSTGVGLTPAVGYGSASGYSTGQIVILDWDSDGFEDFLVPYTPSGTWHLFRSSGLGVAAAVNTGISASSGWIGATPADINGDGQTDVGYISSGVWVYHTRTGPYPDLLQTATDGYGNYVTFNYAPLPSANYTKASDATYPAQDYQQPLYVVNSAVSSNGLVGGSFTNTFHYYAARLNLQGRGLEGFYARRSQDSRNNLIAYEYFNRAFPYTGTTYQSDLVQPNDSTLISRTQNTFAVHAYGSGFEARHLPYLQASNTLVYEVGGTYNDEHIRTVATTNTVDAATGTLYESITTSAEPSTANGAQPGAQYVEHVHSTLSNDFVNWCFGRPAVTQQIRYHNQTGGVAQTRRVDTFWNGAMCRPTQTQVQPGDGLLQVTTDLAYDGFGNANSETVTGVGMTARTTTVDWGTTGQFPVSITRPVSAGFSETSQKTWNYAHGVQASETDPNGTAVSWLHDNFGRVIRENRADSTATDIERTACDASNSYCGDSRLRSQQSTILRDNTNQALRSDLHYFDAFDRLAYDEPKLFGTPDRGYVVIQYDALGRVSQQSARTLAAAPQLYWTTYQYDLLSRPTQESQPVSDSDPTLQTTYAYYEGATTRSVDAEGKQSTSVVSAVGGVIRSIDHAGYYQNFAFDAFGNLVFTTDSLGNTLGSATYNIAGMRLTSSDLDLGAWTYTPNALGELVSQTDANGKITTFTYDRQSRPLTQVMPEGAGSITSTWTWGQSAPAKNIGKLTSAQISGTGITTYTEAFTFDSLGRPIQAQVTEGANNYYVNTTYKTETGFVDTLTYPTSTSSYRLKLQYEYQNGYLLRVRDFNVSETVFWQANATNPRGQITDEEFENGLRTTRSFDLISGLPDYIRTGPGGGTSIQNLSYLWDKVGNLKQRHDVNQSLTEDIYYDDLHRFEHSTRNGSTNLTLTYNGTGGILSKTGVGTYTYHATKIHAVSSINTGGGTWNYSYDAAGNMTSRNGTEILWFANNLPKRIRKTPGSSTDSSEFQYGPSGNRWRHDYRKGTTLYTHVYVGGLLEKVTEGSNVEWKHYIHANGFAVALYERHSNGTNSTHYFLKDHLGSTDVIANSSGAVFVRESFDAFGKRRGTNWTGTPTATEIDNMNTSTRRGFTFHEHLDSTDLIHMGGRVYDPLIGRFASPDPFVPHPLSTQSFNRYSYAQNNPLSRIDPSGFGDEDVESWADDMSGGDAEERLNTNILALFEAAMANGGDPPDTFGMSGMQLVQARFGQFTFGGRSPPVAMNLPSTTRGTWSLEYIRGGDSYVNGSFDGGATMETGGRRTEGSYYWIFRRSACIGTAEQCGNSSFFRDNFFGRTLSSALGDPLARFNDGTNPISGAGLSPGQQFDAQFLGLASIATAGIPAASTTRGVSALVTKTEGLILTHGRTLSKAAFAKLKEDIAANGIRQPILYHLFNGQRYVVNGNHRVMAARQLGMRQVPAEEVDLPYLGYRSVADFFDRGW